MSSESVHPESPLLSSLPDMPEDPENVNETFEELQGKVQQNKLCLERLANTHYSYQQQRRELNALIDRLNAENDRIEAELRIIHTSENGCSRESSDLREKYQRVINEHNRLNDSYHLSRFTPVEPFSLFIANAESRVKLNAISKGIEDARDKIDARCVEIYRRREINARELVEAHMKRQKLHRISAEFLDEWDELDKKWVEVYRAFKRTSEAQDALNE